MKLLVFKHEKQKGFGTSRINQHDALN